MNSKAISDAEASILKGRIITAAIGGSGKVVLGLPEPSPETMKHFTIGTNQYPWWLYGGEWLLRKMRTAKRKMVGG